MHYIDEGQGEPILFLHGNGVWSYLWRNVLPYLSGLGRCIAPDLIGMGRSDKPPLSYGFFEHAAYLDRFIEQLNLKNITLVVHDWGSALGLHYAARHPENVRAITLMKALLKPFDNWDDFPIRFRKGFERLRTPSVGWDMIMKDNAFIEWAVPESQFRRLSEPEMNAYREPFRDPNHRYVTWRWPNEIPIDGTPADTHQIIVNYSQWLQQSDLPKLLLCATPRAIINEQWRGWCEQHLKNLEVVNIGAGIHYIQEDNPHGIGRELARWYRSIIDQKPAKKFTD